MEQEKSFWGSLLNYIGMLAGMFVVYFIVCLGYHNMHVIYQRVTKNKFDVDNGAAARFAQRLFGLMAIFFLVAIYIFKKYNWYETHDAVTEVVIKGYIGFLLMGVLMAIAGVEE